MSKFYSQFGEDKYLVEHCKLPENGVFVDVGAGDIENSNSLHFEQKGWFVLCIEPDERHEHLKDRALVDHSVIGKENGTAPFTFHRFPQLSGTHHKNPKAEKLPMYTLDTVLERYEIKTIDILSIDVEGAEEEVLGGFSIDKYQPTYIIIEYTNQFKGNQEEVTKKLLPGYTVVLKTQSNLVMQRVG